jgi:hypothetical protein
MFGSKKQVYLKIVKVSVHMLKLNTTILFKCRANILEPRVYGGDVTCVIDQPILLPLPCYDEENGYHDKQQTSDGSASNGRGYLAIHCLRRVELGRRRRCAPAATITTGGCAARRTRLHVATLCSR